MIRGCSFSSVALLAVGIALSGCAGSRSLTKHSSGQPLLRADATASEKKDLPEKQVSPEHLKQVGDLLAAQGRKGYAEEVYRWARQNNRTDDRQPELHAKGENTSRSSGYGPASAPKRSATSAVPSFPEKVANRQAAFPLPLPADATSQRLATAPSRHPSAGRLSATRPTSAPLSSPHSASAGQSLRGEARHSGGKSLGRGESRMPEESGSPVASSVVSSSSAAGTGRGQTVHTARSREFTIRVIPATRKGPPQVTEFRFPALPEENSDRSEQRHAAERRPVPVSNGGRRVTPIAGKSSPPQQDGPVLSSESDVSAGQPRPFPAVNPHELTEILPAKSPASRPVPMQRGPERNIVRKRTPVAARLPRPVAIQRELARMYKWLKQPEKHLDEAIERLLHDEPVVRAMAAFVAGRAGTQAAPLVPRLEDALKAEKDGRVSVRLAEALLRIQSDHPLGLSTLLEEMNTSERSARWEAVCVADVLRGHSAEEAAVDLLLKRLHDADPRIAVMSALKLGEFPASAGKTRPVLEQLLREKQTPAKLRRAVAASLKVLNQHGKKNGEQGKPAE